MNPHNKQLRTTADGALADGNTFEKRIGIVRDLSVSLAVSVGSGSLQIFYTNIDGSDGKEDSGGAVVVTAGNEDIVTRLAVCCEVRIVVTATGDTTFELGVTGWQ